MDLVRDVYDFSHGALRNFNQQILNLLDPNGILKSRQAGYWAKAIYRKDTKLVNVSGELVNGNKL